VGRSMALVSTTDRSGGSLAGLTVQRALLLLLLGLSACPRHDPGPRDRLLALERGRCLALERRLRAARARIHALGPPALPRLGRDRALLGLYPEKGRILRFWVRGEAVRALPSRDLRQAESLVIAARDEIEHGGLDPALGKLSSLLSRLRRELLGGADLKGIRSLVVAADGLLRIAPVHALVTGRAKDRPRFLIEELELAYSACLGLPERAAKIGGAAVIAPRYAGGHVPAGVEQEIAGIERAYPDRVQTVREARPADLLAALGRDEAVCFAGHGLADLAPGTTPELLFAEGDPPLTLSRLSARPVHAPLVALSACATAFPARFRDGERLWARTGPVEALLGAGAGGVIAASWIVKGRLSARQMSTLHRELARGRAPARALARSQRDLIRRLELAHPRFWAGYALYGGWR